jgi:hypothetical protein
MDTNGMKNLLVIMCAPGFVAVSRPGLLFLIPLCRRQTPPALNLDKVQQEVKRNP